MIFQKLLSILIIVLGVLEAKVGIQLNPENNNKNLSESDSKFYKFQKTYFVIMGAYSMLIGIISFIKPLSIILLLVLALTPLLADKLIGNVWIKKHN